MKKSNILPVSLTPFDIDAALLGNDCDRIFTEYMYMVQIPPLRYRTASTALTFSLLSDRVCYTAKFFAELQ